MPTPFSNEPVRNSLSVRAITYAIVFLALFALYLHRAAPSITVGDSAELAAAASSLGIAHPPGYPLYVICGRLAAAFVPWGNPAYRLNLFSALLGALACVVCAAVCFRVTGRLSAGVLCAVLLGTTPLWIQQSTVCEVFALNSLLAALALGAACLARADLAPKLTLVCALTLALGLGNQHTLVLLAPALVIAAGSRQLLRPRMLVLLVACVLIGASVYALIPIRAAQAPMMNWEEASTFDRFWKLITRARYGTFQLAQGGSRPWALQDVFGALQFSVMSLRENLGVFALLGLASVAACWRQENRRTVLALFVAFLCTGPLFIALTQVAPTERTRFILDRFFYLPLVPWACLMGIGMASVIGRWRMPNVEGVVAVIAVGVFVFAWRLEGPSHREDFELVDFGRNFLRSVPVNAILLADRADEAEFSIAYLQRVSGYRTDVSFIDCNAGVSRSIYGSDYYDIWGRPRLALRTAREKQLIASTTQGVYYATHEPEMIPIPRRQEGIVFAATGKPRAIAWEAVLSYRPWRSRIKGKSIWNRGLHADYLSKLAATALSQNDRPAAQHLYAGTFAYEGHSDWRTQMERYLAKP